jgi:hypothetical protein
VPSPVAESPAHEAVESAAEPTGPLKLSSPLIASVLESEPPPACFPHARDPGPRFPTQTHSIHRRRPRIALACHRLEEPEPRACRFPPPNCRHLLPNPSLPVWGLLLPSLHLPVGGRVPIRIVVTAAACLGPWGLQHHCPCCSLALALPRRRLIPLWLLAIARCCVVVASPVPLLSPHCFHRLVASPLASAKVAGYVEECDAGFHCFFSRPTPHIACLQRSSFQFLLGSRN